MIKKISSKILLLIFCLIPLAMIFVNYLFTKNIFVVIAKLTYGLITSTLIAGLCLALIFLFISVKIGNLRLKDFLLDSKEIKKGIICTLILWLTVNLLSMVFSFLENSHLALNDYLIYRFGSFIAQFFGNAFAEELIYRGILLIQIYLFLKIKFSNKKSILWAIVISQLFFSLSHIPNRIVLEQTKYLLLELIKLFILGIIFSLIFIKTQNLIYLIGVHSLLNAPFCLFKTQEFLPILIALLLSIIIAIFWNKINNQYRDSWFKKGLEMECDNISC